MLFSAIIICINHKATKDRIIPEWKCKKDKKRKKPIEVQYLVNCYNLDLKKVNYKRLLNIISLVSSLDIAIVVTIIGLTNNFLLEIIIGCFLTVILILASYYIVGKIYQKKGYCK